MSWPCVREEVSINKPSKYRKDQSYHNWYCRNTDVVILTWKWSKHKLDTIIHSGDLNNGLVQYQMVKSSLHWTLWCFIQFLGVQWSICQGRSDFVVRIVSSALSYFLSSNLSSVVRIQKTTCWILMFIFQDIRCSWLSN